MYFDCGLETLTGRIKGRKQQRKDELPEIMNARLNIFNEKTIPLIHYFESRSILIRISSESNKDLVFGVAQKYFRPRILTKRNVICIMGCHGSGKSTLAKTLSQNIGAQTISVSDLILEEIGRGFHLGTDISNEMDQGDAIRSEFVLHLIHRYLRNFVNSSDQILIMDGFPFSLEQLELLERSIGSIELIIDLNASLDVIKDRSILDPQISERKHLVYMKSTDSLSRTLSSDSRYHKIDASASIQTITTIATSLCFRLIDSLQTMDGSNIQEVDDQVF